MARLYFPDPDIYEWPKCPELSSQLNFVRLLHFHPLRSSLVVLTQSQLIFSHLMHAGDQFAM